MKWTRHPLSRSSNYAQAPYSIEDVNRERPSLKYSRWVQIGAYTSNGSRLLLNRDDESVLLVDQPGEKTLCTWQDIESFLTNEPSRLATLYSPNGKLLVDHSLTVPSAARVM